MSEEEHRSGSYFKSGKGAQSENKLTTGHLIIDPNLNEELKKKETENKLALFIGIKTKKSYMSILQGDIYPFFPAPF